MQLDSSVPPTPEMPAAVPSEPIAATEHPKVLIVAEHASARFGGEAALPLHYFRVLLSRNHPVWLITHSRVRDELLEIFPQARSRIHFIEDGWLHKLMWKLGQRLPTRIAYFSTGFISRLSTQLTQRRIARNLIQAHGIDIVHQPIPVSPKEPSTIFGLGVPVVIGPMNGGMEYPPTFRKKKAQWVSGLTQATRSAADLMNRILPGKYRAAALLVANERTRRALPADLQSAAIVIPENGVDLKVWAELDEKQAEGHLVRFVFMGRLIALKAVDLLIEAFHRAAAHAPMSLTVIGDGPERAALESQATHLKRMAHGHAQEGTIEFTGWRPQSSCATFLRQCDGLIFPSLMDCGGAVVLEAMSCGLPVISTAWGGPLDYLDDSCGILVEPTSRESLIEGLAKAMVLLAQNPQLRKDMGIKGRARVLEKFDWERKVDEMLSLYRNLSGQADTEGSCIGSSRDL